LDVIKAAGKKVGTLPKDQISGPFVDEWKKAFGDISKDAQEVDVAQALSSAAFSAKDEAELVSGMQPTAEFMLIILAFYP
jgi:nucleosome binding factor SPN SPT16 subunit